MLFKIINGLDRNRFLPQVIALTKDGELGLRIRELGVPVKVMEMKPNFCLIGKFVTLVRTLRCFKPDVISTWMYHADLVGGLAARISGVSAVGWGIRNSDLSPSRSKFSTRCVMRICAALSCCIPRKILNCSEKARRHHEQLGYDKDKMVVRLRDDLLEDVLREILDGVVVVVQVPGGHGMPWADVRG